MKLDGDKLINDIDQRIRMLFNSIDMNIENGNYESISMFKVEIDSLRRVLMLIASGDYTID